ncbi:MAG: hypothetical protein QOE41_1086 [Mycobacterium sp.]|jgi:hypothetical protein|nr:hypothetical protein [Mycobacterium sp.]MDT5131775.1 hypothetical protein [Mycobacterium sp.]
MEQSRVGGNDRDSLVGLVGILVLLVSPAASGITDMMGCG